MKKEYALKMDDNDQLSYLKKEFLYGDGNDSKKIYFCGNSLGLQHYSLKNKINKHLEQWKALAVENHFSGDYPWMDIQDKIKEKLKLFLGCSENEIARWVAGAWVCSKAMQGVGIGSPSEPCDPSNAGQMYLDTEENK